MTWYEFLEMLEWERFLLNNIHLFIKYCEVARCSPAIGAVHEFRYMWE